MARSDDDDILEPILPKHPPVAGDPPPPEEPVTPRTAEEARGAPWHRTVLVVCAVVATLALVFCAVQLSSIADDQRLQACQVRVYAEETIVEDREASRASRSDLRERFADCLGIEIEPEEEDEDGGAARTGDD